REINSLRIFGTTKDKGPIVSFELKGAHPHDVATIIDRAGVAVRAGTHCVMPLLARFGVTATCRASFGLYNTRAEVDGIAQALIKAQGFFARLTSRTKFRRRQQAHRPTLRPRPAPAPRRPRRCRKASWRGSPTTSSPRSRPSMIRRFPPISTSSG